MNPTIILPASGDDIKQSDGGAPVLLKLWGLQSTPSLPLLLDPLWPRVIAPDGVLLLYIDLRPGRAVKIGHAPV